MDHHLNRAVRGLACVGLALLASIALAAAPAHASGTPIAAHIQDSGMEWCDRDVYQGGDGNWYRNYPNDRWVDIGVHGAHALIRICWNNTYGAKVTGSVKDTAPDGVSATVRLRFQHWDNPIDGWHWHDYITLGKASGNTKTAYFSGEQTNSDEVKAFQVKACAGSTCTGWS